MKLSYNLNKNLTWTFKNDKQILVYVKPKIRSFQGFHSPGPTKTLVLTRLGAQNAPQTLTLFWKATTKAQIKSLYYLVHMAVEACVPGVPDSSSKYLSLHNICDQYITCDWLLLVLELFFFFIILAQFFQFSIPHGTFLINFSIWISGLFWLVPMCWPKVSKMV